MLLEISRIKITFFKIDINQAPTFFFSYFIASALYFYVPFGRLRKFSLPDFGIRSRRSNNASPLILLARSKSFRIKVTLLAWRAQRLASSKTPTRQASEASWRATSAELWNRRSESMPPAIDLTTLWNGALGRRFLVAL